MLIKSADLSISFLSSSLVRRHQDTWKPVNVVSQFSHLQNEVNEKIYLSMVLQCLLAHSKLSKAITEGGWWGSGGWISRDQSIYRAVIILCWRRQWQPTPVLLPGKSHGQRSLGGYSPWGPEELDMTERLHFHFSFLCIGEGNGNPLQCPCLENPRDRGAWWAAVNGVAQSRTQLTWLSSSSSIILCVIL